MDGSEIRELRTRLGLTQKALADVVGVSANTVARWERGQLGISPAMNDRLLAASASLPSGAAITGTPGVILDLHHRAILEGLNGQLDPEVFEACAVELLHQVWPGIVPVRGGGDDGFDGAVPDPACQEPFPLIVTTGTNLLRNFRASLESAKRKGWTPRRALFATSRRIPPAIRRKLFDVARERGVILVQTFDQDWFAGRLYREPPWCKRLLGVTGRPPALSAFPITQRPVLGDEVLGREQEMQWLLASRGDCLLIGQPGSGKTFLLRALALQGRALFLVEEDREQIADDLRSLQPSAVIVDDTHVRPHSIGMLDQLRRDIRADFRIIASCWPGEAESVRAGLKIAQPDTLTLEQVDADTTIEIIKSVGVQGPNELLRSIKEQAAGRPGLAATLAHLCIVGDIESAISGEGLVDSIASDLDHLLDFEAMRLLAPFALGGDAGTRQDDVAELLDLSLLDVSSALAKLAAAGLIQDRGNSAVSVEPRSMRRVLVRRFFFSGPGSLPVERFLSVVRNRTNSIETLIATRAGGGDVPDLERLLDEANSKHLWNKYAWVGPECADYALDRDPEIIADLAEPALEHIPERAIPLLLLRAKDSCQNDAVPDSALHSVKQWIMAGNSRGWNEILDRRRKLLKHTEAWWRQTRNTPVSVAAMCLAFEPDFDFATLDPGAGTRVTFAKATLGAGVIKPLARLWPSMTTILRAAIDIPYINIMDLVEAWCHSRLNNDHETRNAAAQFLSRILQDVASASRQCPGIQHRIAELAKETEIAVDVNLDPEFEYLYPLNPYGADNLDREHARLADDVSELAKRWINRDAVDIARLLGRMEIEARRARIGWPRLTPQFCKVLAAEHTDPVTALETFMNEHLPADLVEPFLCRIVETGGNIWPIVSDCFNDDLYLAIAIQHAICHENAPLEMVTSALAKATDAPQLIEHYCARGEVSHTSLFEMFRSSNAATAVTAAIGHWKAVRYSLTETPLDDTWRRAFLRSAENRISSTDSYWTGVILQGDGELAVEWLVRFLDSDQCSLGFYAGEAATSVIANLDSSQRISILTAVCPSEQFIGTPEIISALVGRDVNIYPHLLKLDRLKYYHLSPLLGEPSGAWRKIAALALDHGFSPRDVVEANLGGERSWAGHESLMWAELRRHYEELKADDDIRVSEIGEVGARIVGKMEQRAKERERDEAVYGLS